MRPGHRRTVTMLVGMGLAYAVVGARALAETAPKPAENAYKNIKILKGAPADQLIPAMQFISASLGVDCEFCHVRGKFESDEKKPKQTARAMIEMMSAINKERFEGKREVTCFTCHHGSPKVAGFPPVGEYEEHGEEPAAKPGSLPSPSDVLARYAQASGGSEALEKITSRVQKGTLTGFGDKPLPIEVYSKAPASRASIMHLPQGDSVTAFDGKSGWLGSPGRPPRIMSAAESDAARLDADLALASHLKDLFREFRVEPVRKVNGRDALLVVARNEGRPPVELYFDTESGLLLRLVRYVETPLGRNPTQIDYDDYREADGVRVPFKWTLSRPGSRFTIQIAETQQNGPVADSVFEMPAGAPPPPESR